jgi:hypothetical protein
LCGSTIRSIDAGRIVTRVNTVLAKHNIGNYKNNKENMIINKAGVIGGYVFSGDNLIWDPNSTVSYTKLFMGERCYGINADHVRIQIEKGKIYIVNGKDHKLMRYRPVLRDKIFVDDDIFLSIDCSPENNNFKVLGIKQQAYSLISYIKPLININKGYMFRYSDYELWDAEEDRTLQLCRMLHECEGSKLDYIRSCYDPQKFKSQIDAVLFYATIGSIDLTEDGKNNFWTGVKKKVDSMDEDEMRSILTGKVIEKFEKEQEGDDNDFITELDLEDFGDSFEVIEEDDDLIFSSESNYLNFGEFTISDSYGAASNLDETQKQKMARFKGGLSEIPNEQYGIEDRCVSVSDETFCNLIFESKGTFAARNRGFLGSNKLIKIIMNCIEMYKNIAYVEDYELMCLIACLEFCRGCKITNDPKLINRDKNNGLREGVCDVVLNVSVRVKERFTDFDF